MKTTFLPLIPDLSELPTVDRAEAVERLLALCHEQREQLALQAEKKKEKRGQASY